MNAPRDEPTRVVLVRHGESAWHAENRYAGSTDVPMTAHGHRQAAELAQWARSARPDAVWCSPQSRAHQTALPSAAATGLTPVVDERLRELDFGIAEGLTRAEMHQRFPEDLARFVADPVAGRFPTGEEPTAAVDRFTACLHDLVAAHPGGRLLVVAHSTVMRLALCTLLGIEPARYRTVLPHLGNCTLTEIVLPGHPAEASAALLTYNSPVPQALTATAAAQSFGGTP